MNKKTLTNKLKQFFKAISAPPALSSLLSNAYRGLPNSQFELANYYLYETEHIIEAYAWAEVACCRRLPGAQDLRKQAQERLKPEQIREAWILAREYKQTYIPKTL